MADRPTMTRTIIMCAPDHYILAVRAAKYLLDRPDRKDAWLEYGEDAAVSMYAKRLPKSVKVVQVKP